MAIRVVVTRDFEEMSRVGGELVVERLQRFIRRKREVVLGLATGISPTGLYKRLAQAANAGEVDTSRIRSFNLDEYVGLPGENAQQRAMHPESYTYFMIRELFGLLRRPLLESSVPWGSLIEQRTLERELRAHRGDWREEGSDAGRSIVIRPRPASQYLGWIRREILEGYARKIRRAGGIDLQIVGVGGRGHVAFHEAGIPFRGSRMLLVRLDENTISNAVADGHFPSVAESPRYAITMGAELVYQARSVVLLASGERKVEAVTRSLLEEPTPQVPISYGQIYAARGGELTYVLDRVAGRELLTARGVLKQRGVEVLEVE